MSDVDLPVAHVRDQVASALDVVVHMARLHDGRRVVYEIASVDGVRDGEPIVSELFGFRPRLGGRGAFVCTGVVPPLAEVLRERGEEFGDLLFRSGVDALDPGAIERSLDGVSFRD